MSQAERSSQVVVNIPVAGDQHQPQLQDFYQADILSNGSLSGNTTFTATDDDVLIANNVNFKLIPGETTFYFLSFHQLDMIQTATVFIWTS